MRRISFLSLVKEKILFVDTETTGIPQDQSLSYKNIDNWPTIKQIAWIVYRKNGSLEHAYNYVISPEIDSSVPKTSDYCAKVILPIYSVLDLFLQSLQQCDVIVGHNIAYDVQVILCELYRYGKDTSRLESMQQFCTMKNTVEICGFDTRRGDRYPKLQELYSKLFHQPFENAHDAYCDIKATADCFWTQFSHGLLKKEDFPFLMSSTEKEGSAEIYINKAVDLVDKYVKRGCDAKDEKPLKALSFFENALKLKPYSSTLKDRVGIACLKCAREMYSGGDMTTSFRFFEKAAETEYGEAMAVQANFVHDDDKKEALLLKAIDKGWIDAAYSLHYLYKKQERFSSAKKYAKMWLEYCEENFDSLPYDIATWYIRGYLFGDLDHPADYNKAKILCERSITNGLGNYSQYAKLLELRKEWGKRFEILNTDYFECLKRIEQQGGVEVITKWGYSRERRELIRRLSLIVECFFEGKGTEVNYAKAKELIDLGVSLYGGYSYKADYEEYRLLYYYLGQFYERGLNGISVNYEQAFKCYNFASEDIPQAAKQLGIMYLYGRGCKKSKKQARIFLTYAQNKGLDVSPYLENAKSWFR